MTAVVVLAVLLGGGGGGVSFASGGLRFQLDPQRLAVQFPGSTDGIELTPRAMRANRSLPRLSSVAREGERRFTAAGDDWSLRLDLRAVGAESSWDFDALPTGTGDLVVGFDLPAGVAVERQGEQVRVCKKAHCIHIGEATWVDAEQRRRTIAATIDRGAIRWRIGADVLRDTQFPATLDPTISAEFSFDDPVTTPNAFSESYSAVSFDGTNHLIFTTDGRGIMAKRFTPAGAAVDTDPVWVSNVPAQNQDMSSAFNGTNHMLVWSNTTSGLRALRVSPARAPVDVTPLSFGTTARFGKVASDGSGWFVVWEVSTTPTTIRGSRISAAGVNLDPGGIAIATGGVGIARTTPDVSFNGTNYLVVWRELNPMNGFNEVVARRYTTAGVAVDAAPFILTAGRNAENPAVAAVGSTWLVVFREFRPSAGFYATRVTAAGVVQDPAGFTVDSSVASFEPPYIAGGTTDWLVVFKDSNNVPGEGNAVRVTTSGTIAGSAKFGTTSYVYVREVELGAGNWLAAVTMDGFNASSDLKAVSFSASGAPISSLGTDFRGGMNNQGFEGITAVGGRYTGFWRDDRSPLGVYESQLNATGTRLTTPIQVGAFYDTGGRIVGASSTQTVRTDCFGASRISSTGALLDASPIPLGLPSSPIGCAIGSDGTTFLIASGGTNAQAVRLSSAGVVLDAPPLTVSSSPGNQYPSGVAFGASTWLVAWTDDRNSAVTGNDVFAARLNSSGVLLDPTGIAVNIATGSQSVLDTVFGGGVFLVVWAFSTGSTTTLQAARVTAAGTVLDTTPLTLGTPFYGGGAAVGWLGNAFLIVFTDAAGVVRGTLVLPDGTVVSPSSEVLSTEATPHGNVAVGTDGTNRAMLGYNRTIDAGTYGGVTVAPYFVGRAFAKLLTYPTGSLGSACSVATDCISNNCVDGFCCNTACGGGVVDCQGCSVATGATQNGTCTFYAAGTLCRPDAGECDVPDSCSGTSGTCPNVFVSGTAICRPADGGCDAVERCPGNGALCPIDRLSNAGVSCHASTGPCDPAELCSGTSNLCPADVIADAGTICRASQGTCDVAEVCDGVAVTCPANTLSPAGTECRAVAGTCDVAEVCNGTVATCPADTVLPATTTCRAAAGTCDVAESCTGSSGACPADAFAPATTTCRAAAGTCDVAESCSGSGALCPADSFEPATTECRAQAGACDVAESCTGASGACPADALTTAGTECRPSLGVCDAPETCTGIVATCPTNAFEPAGTLCRAALSECDVAETCSGTATTCPSNSVQPDGTMCSVGMCLGGACQGGAGGGSGGSGGGAAGGAAGGGTAGGGAAGGAAGGSTAGGSTAGGSTAGGSTAGGSTAGGSTAGGSTAGGSTAGGSTAGGSTAGGSTAGGSTAGGTGGTAGGSGATAGGTGGTSGGAAGGEQMTSGCGCQSTDPFSQLAMWALLVGLASAARRRRAATVSARRD